MTFCKKTMALLSLFVLMNTTYAGFVIDGVTKDESIRVHVQGDASWLGFTKDESAPLPCPQALVRLFPDWKIDWQDVEPPTFALGWTRGTQRLEVLQELSRNAHVTIFVDVPHERIVFAKPWVNEIIEHQVNQTEGEEH